jgi:hypothetical protein
LRRDEIAADTPLRLDIAAQIAFPDGSMTVSGLRRERNRGRLVTSFVAGKEYVTLHAIAEMIALCRVARPAPALSSNPPNTLPTAVLPDMPPGLSEIGDDASAQDYARNKLQRLSDASRSSSSKRPKVKQPAPASVTRLAFRSPM